MLLERGVQAVTNRPNMGPHFGATDWERHFRELEKALLLLTQPVPSPVHDEHEIVTTAELHASVERLNEARARRWESAQRKRRAREQRVREQQQRRVLRPRRPRPVSALSHDEPQVEKDDFGLEF